MKKTSAEWICRAAAVKEAKTLICTELADGSDQLIRFTVSDVGRDGMCTVRGELCICGKEAKP